MTTHNNQHKREGGGGDMAAAKAMGEGKQQPTIDGSSKGKRRLEPREK
jgi:hypothetical protein